MVWLTGGARQQWMSTYLRRTVDPDVRKPVDNFVGTPDWLSNVRAMHAAGPSEGRTSPTIDVDFAALGRVLNSLRELSHELSARDGTLHEVLTESPIHAALRHAERDWHDRRARLASILARAADSLNGALTAYREVDDAIGGSARSVAR